MTETNQVYNSHFLLWQESKPDFPDGWVQKGGDTATKWEWVGTADGPRAIKIVHPSGPRAGIILENSVVISAGEDQRWEIRTILQTESPEIPCYIRIYLGAVTVKQYLFSTRPGLEPEEYMWVFSTSVGVTGILVEVGIAVRELLVFTRFKARGSTQSEPYGLTKRGKYMSVTWIPLGRLNHLSL